MDPDQNAQAATWFFASIGPQHLTPDELAAYHTFKRRAARQQQQHDRKKQK